MQLPALVIEPGRSIVAEAGISLYTVGRIKDIPGVRKYVSVDGGMTDNIRPALYQAQYKECWQTAPVKKRQRQLHSAASAANQEIS